MKNKDRKYFLCQKFGHIATDCPEKDSDVKKNNCIVMIDNNKYCWDVRICDENISALIDTGSDISLMREKQYKAFT